MKDNRKTAPGKQSGKKKNHHDDQSDQPNLRLPVVTDVQARYATRSRIRAIGNSRGVILSNRVLEEGGIGQEADILIQAIAGMIIIRPAEKVSAVNTNLA